MPDPLGGGSVTPSGLAPGVSVIIPSHLGRDRLWACLRSLAAQTLEPDRFEIVVVLNGPADGSRTILKTFRAAYPCLTLTVVDLPDAGTSNARNAGIASATREHLTFVDDDDSASAGYLETLLAHAAPGVVPLGQIVNLVPGGGVDVSTAINLQTISYAGRTVPPEQIPRALGFNACKLIPTAQARRIAYDASLSSGVDVVFFMTLLAHHDFRIHVCPVDSGPDARNAVYYRLLRPDSMSRRQVSFEFNVLARLEVIARIQALRPRCDDGRLQVLRSTIRAQAGFIERYLAARPGDTGRVLDAISTYRIADFPYRALTSLAGRG
jgi:glycosyltransferase involved in cell wall biosynthesis